MTDMSPGVRFGSFAAIAAILVLGGFPAPHASAQSSVKAAAAPSVTAGGTPSYSIPIAVPPGAGALRPAFALSYAGGVNGPVGFGWSLEGVSIIDRCDADIRVDGARRGVNLDSRDKLCLDGERLLSLDSSGNPQTGVSLQDAGEVPAGQYREYRTQKDSYARIRAYGTATSSASSGPAYFKVWTKSGRIYEYGASPSADANTHALVVNSAPAAQPRTFAQAWAVSRITDLFGNFVDFKYDQRDVAWGSSGTYRNGHEWNLVEVQYSGNKVVFAYVDRGSTSPQDSAEAYHLGSKNVSIRRLSSLTTYVNSPNTTVLGPASGASAAVAVRTYKLGYDNGPVTKRSRLTSVQECAGDASSAKCLPKTSVQYTAGGDQAYQSNPKFNLGNVVLYNNPHIPPQNTLFFGNYGVVGEDFDGDGVTDLLRWSDDASQNVLYLNNGDGSFTPAASFNLQGFRLFSDDSCYASIFRDMNGDGIMDIFRYAAPTGHYAAIGNNNCTNAANEPSYVLIGNGSGGFTKYAVSGATPLISYESMGVNGDTDTWSTGYNFYLVDYDGDGRMDIVTSMLPAGSGDARSAGFNGCNASTVCTRVFRNTGTPGAFSEITTASAHMNLFQNARGTELGGKLIDSNADGLKDLSLRAPAQVWLDSVGVAISNGDGTFTADANAGCLGTLNGKLIDYNGDGRPDCLIPYSSMGQASKLAVYDLAGGTAVVLSNSNIPVSATSTSVGALAITGDFNEDGRADIIAPSDGTTANPNILYLSNGDGTVTASPSFNLGSTVLVSAYAPNLSFVPGDFQGNGNFEFLRTYNASTQPDFGSANVLYAKTHPERPDVLLSITTPAGANYTFTQVPLTKSNAANSGIGVRYVSDRGTSAAAAWPAVDVVAPAYVVATISADSGVGSNRKLTEYKYFGLKVDALAGAPLGFREMREQSIGADGSPLTTVTQYSLDRPYVGMPTNVSSYASGLTSVASTNRLLSTTNVYCDQLLPVSSATTAVQSLVSCPSSLKMQRPYLLLTKQMQWDLDGTVMPTRTVQTAVNSDGEPTTATTKVVGPGGDTFTGVVTNSYQADDTSCADAATCNWVIGKSTLRTVKNTVPGTLATTNAGSSPTATATKGTAAVAPSIAAVLLPVLSLILGDD